MKKDKGKYDKILTIFLIIIFIAFIILIGPHVFNYLSSEYTVRKTLEDFDETTTNEKENSNIDNVDNLENVTDNLDEVLNELDSDQIIDDDNESSSTKGTNNKNKNKNKNNQTINYDAVGKIEIPKIKVNYPIYANINKETLETGVAIAYGPGVNEIGNTVIYGHNFRNGKFFSNNKKLSIGDNIYITDLSGNQAIYTIYNIYITTPTDASYMVRDTAGRREISLQTCTDDNSGRLIIWATAD